MSSGSARERKATQPSEHGPFDQIWMDRLGRAVSGMPPLVIRLGKACQDRAKILKTIALPERLEIAIVFEDPPDASPKNIVFSATGEAVLGNCDRCIRAWVSLEDACVHIQGGAFLYLSSRETSRSPKGPDPGTEPAASLRSYSPSRPSGVFLTRLPPDWGFLIRTGLRQAMSHRSYLDWSNRFRQPTGHRLPEYPIWKAIHEAFFLEEIREWRGERYPLFFPKPDAPLEMISERGGLHFYRPGETDPVPLMSAEPSWRFAGRWTSSETGFRFRGNWQTGKDDLPAKGSRWLERKRIRILDAPSALVLLQDPQPLPLSLAPFLDIDPDGAFPLEAWTDRIVNAMELGGHARLFFHWDGKKLEDVFSVRENWEPRIDLLYTEGQGLRISPSVQIRDVRIPLFGPERSLQPDIHVRQEDFRTEFLKRDRQKELLLRNVVEKVLRKSSTTAWVHLSPEESGYFWKTGWFELEQGGFSRGETETRSGRLLDGPASAHVLLREEEGGEILAKGVLSVGERVFPMPSVSGDSDDPFVKLNEDDRILLDRRLSEQLEMLSLLFQFDGEGQSRMTPHAAGMILLHRPDLDIRADEEVRKRIRPYLDSPLSLAVEEEPGPGFSGRLRAYQKQGVGWVLLLREKGLHGILADEMGLGKTVTTLSFLSRVLEDPSLPPVLIVVPASLVYNWEKEIRQFLPDVACIIYHGVQRQSTERDFPENSLVITTYGTVRNDIAFLSERHFSIVILDEAQTIKNPDSGISVAVSRLRGDFRLALSGTPLENHLVDLWSLFRFLFPGLLGSRRFFEERYVQGKGGGLWQKERIRWLKALVSPLVLRRTKKDVLSDLPAKTIVDHWVEPGDDERTAYRAILTKGKEDLRARSKDRKAFRMNMLALLLRLRLFCCHPDLVPDAGGIPIPSPAKFTETLAKIREALEDGHRILLFSQFTGMLDILEKALEQEEIAFYRLDGQTPPKERQRLVEGFQRQEPGTPSVFLSSLKAGGVGLTLTNADFVFHYDPWWNPQVENQATDRAHRIGQERPVFVYRMLTRGTVEEKVKALKEEKLELFDLVMGESPPAEQDWLSRQLESLLEWGPG